MSQNVSLMLTKRLSNRIFSSETKETALEDLYTKVADSTAPADYRRAYARWESSIKELPGVVKAARYRVVDRLLIGTGAANVLEFSLSMNRLWGTPMLPGSGLKGLVRHYASWYARQPESQGRLTDDHRLDLFGSEDLSGVVDWLDAWWIPDQDGAIPYERDMLTPHYGSWYRDDTGKSWPDGAEDPIPVGRASIRGSFLVAVHAPDQSWANDAMKLLEWAVSGWGVGAKTNSGYGYLKRIREEGEEEKENASVSDPETKTESAEVSAAAVPVRAQNTAFPEKPAAPAATVVAELIRDVQNPAQQINQRAQNWLQRWSELESESDKVQVGNAILTRLKSKQKEYHRITGRITAGYPKAPGEPKGYAIEFLAFMDAHSDGETA